MHTKSTMDNKAVIESHRERLSRLLERISDVEEKVQEMMEVNRQRLGFRLLQSQLNHLAAEAQIIEDLIEQESKEEGQREE